MTPVITDVESLERATLDAVAPPEVLELENWLLPMDRSTIGRAISAVPLRHQNLDVRSVKRIEAVYQARGLKAQFRIADVAGCAEVHQELRRAGYFPCQATLTMVAPVRKNDGHDDPLVNLQDHPTEAWKSVYLAAEFDPIDGANRVNALIRSTCVRYAHIEISGHAVASGTASSSRDWMGIHGMRTTVHARGRGLASRIIKVLAAQAAKSNLSGIYLQVEESNAAATRLYQALGFSTAWRYHYWKKA